MAVINIPFAISLLLNVYMTFWWKIYRYLYAWVGEKGDDLNLDLNVYNIRRRSQGWFTSALVIAWLFQAKELGLTHLCSPWGWAHDLALRKFSAHRSPTWVQFSSTNTAAHKSGSPHSGKCLKVGNKIYFWPLVVLHKLDLQMKESLLCELDLCLFRTPWRRLGISSLVKFQQYPVF